MGAIGVPISTSEVPILGTGSVVCNEHGLSLLGQRLSHHTITGPLQNHWDGDVDAPLPLATPSPERATTHWDLRPRRPRAYRPWPNEATDTGPNPPAKCSTHWVSRGHCCTRPGPQHATRRPRVCLVAPVDDPRADNVLLCCLWRRLWATGHNR
jgi:hypothetical protein